VLPVGKVAAVDGPYRMSRPSPPDPGLRAQDPSGPGHRRAQCPVCRSTGADPLVRLCSLPVHCNRPAASAEEARGAPLADILLVLCPACCHIYDASIDQGSVDYSPGYENRLEVSPCFDAYMRALARRLIETHSLRDKAVLEIGCGAGTFLRYLCEIEANRGFGFDPAQPADRRFTTQSGTQVSIQAEAFSKSRLPVKADLACARHVLEHLSDPGSLLEAVRQAMIPGKSSVLFIEVPNAIHMLHETAIWDLVFEHRSYFTPQSLGHLVASHGFEVTSVVEAFDGQFLCLEATMSETADPGPPLVSDDLRRAASAFADACHDKVTAWRARLGSTHARAPVVWGTGSKGVTFLNLLDPNALLCTAVDINPHKHGKYVAGTGHEIMPPDHLRTTPPDLVVVMNSSYVEEIKEQLARLNLDPIVVCA